MTSTSSQRTPASWAWWCAGAPPWCSSARRTAWRPSPIPSSSSRTPSGDSELPSPAARAPAGRSSPFYIGYVSVFVIKPQTPSVPEPQNLALSLGFLAGPSSGGWVQPTGLLGAGSRLCAPGEGPCEAGAPEPRGRCGPPGLACGWGRTCPWEGPSGPSLLCPFSAPRRWPAGSPETRAS